MTVSELLNTLTKEHTGELLKAEDDRYSVKLEYKPGTLPLFSKLELLVVDRSKLEVKKVGEKVVISNFEKAEDSFELIAFRVLPMPEVISRSPEPVPDDFLEEFRQRVLNGLLTFVNHEWGVVTVSVGNFEPRGVFFTPIDSSTVLPLVEIEDGRIRVYWETIRRLTL